jgi:hypothetical protein
VKSITVAMLRKLIVLAGAPLTVKPATPTFCASLFRRRQQRHFDIPSG